ncbi:MAG TPA: cyclophilin-like fold protein [Candidatus Acidoferrum sp.]|nr:cyclophilin-like fold protein [Candidatus Acidoferrum sp.]
MTTEEADISRTKIKFVIEGVGEAEGELVRFLAPRTIDMILRKLPIEGRAALWKEEVYFETTIKMGEEKAKGNVENGTIAFWPMGSAVCIFYGTSQPYSPVNILGKVTSNLDVFKQVKSGTKIRIEPLVSQGTLPPQA